MVLTTLHILIWILTAFTITRQASVKLIVSPAITAECGKPVTLNCNASSSLDGLSIKYMEWYQTKPYCSVDSEGKLIIPHKQTPNGFHCEYKQGQLSLSFQKVQPLQSENPFRCKLRSNQGTTHANTTVELQECCGSVEANLATDGPTCTFKQVYPDGDVHWFHGSHNLSDGSLSRTSKSVDEEGWLTIQSYLQKESSHVPYNCSLKSTASGRYIASTLVQKTPQELSLFRSGAAAQGPFLTFFSVLLAFTLGK